MYSDPNSAWNSCLSKIKDNVGDQGFETWFKPIKPLRLEKKILTIQVPSQFFYEYLEEQYIDILRKVIKKELGSDAKLEYNVVMQNNSYNNSKPYTVRFPARSSKEIKNIINEPPPNIVCDQQETLQKLNSNIRKIADRYCNQSRLIVQQNNLTINRFNQLKTYYDRRDDFYQRVQNILLKIQN